MRFNRAFVIVAVTALTALAVGCHRLNGGGWIDGLYGGKAHFGFQARCEERIDADGWYEAAFFVGQFQFMDKSAGVRFHGEIQVDKILFDPEFPVSCEEVGAAVVAELGNYAEFSGECRSQPGKVPGIFTVAIEDLEGQVGWDRNDTISIETDCTPDGEWYANSGQLKGGNLSFAKHKAGGEEE